MFRFTYLAVYLQLMLGNFCLVHSKVEAQVVAVSDEINMSKDAQYDLLGQFQGKVFLTRETESEISLFSFDHKLFFSAEKSLNLGYKKVMIHGKLPLEEYIDVFFSTFQKEGHSIHCKRFDYSGNLVDSMLIKEASGQGLPPKYKISYSQNKRWAVIHHMDREENLLALYIDVLNRELVAEHFYSFSNLNFRNSFKDILITEFGDMIIILDNMQAYSKKPEPEISIIHTGPNIKEPSLIIQSFLPFIVKDALVKLDIIHQRLVLSGLYTVKNYNESIGVMYALYDLKTRSIDTVHYIPFDIETLVGQKYGRKNRPDMIPDIYPIDLIIRHDGGILLLIEERKEFERSLYQGRRDFYGMRFAVDFYYDDIFAVAINPDGKSHWQKRFQKRQYSFDDDALYSSFFIFKTPSFIRLIYNDEIKNENTVSEYVLTGGGLSERKNVMNTNRQDLRLQLIHALQISPTEYIVPSVRRNKLKLVKVTYND